MADTWGWQFETYELAYTRIEIVHKVRKKTFVFMWLLYVQYNYWEDRTYTRLCEPLWSNRPEPSPETMVHNGDLKLAHGGLILKIC